MNAKPVNVACIGKPGSGKTTIGRQLAKRLDISFFDSDSVIERHIGCSIREFFERDSEKSFRDLEQEVINELTQSGSCVLSTGGGVVLQQINRDNLHQRCQVVYLHSAPEEIFRRLQHDRHRPLLQVPDPLAKLKELYELRDPLYRETAHFVIETGRPSVSTMVNMIVMQLEVAGVIGQ